MYEYIRLYIVVVAQTNSKRASGITQPLSSIPAPPKPSSYNRHTFTCDRPTVALDLYPAYIQTR